jgi:hypothetical protein
MSVYIVGDIQITISYEQLMSVYIIGDIQITISYEKLMSVYVVGDTHDFDGIMHSRGFTIPYH